MHFCSLTCTKNKSVSKVGETPILKADTMATKRRPPNSVVNKGIYHLGLEQSLHIYIYTSNNNYNEIIIIDTCKSRNIKNGQAPQKLTYYCKTINVSGYFI